MLILVNDLLKKKTILFHLQIFLVEVYEDNRIRINFDGWTSNFDYTVETDNSDLHPCGYWEYVQRVLYKNVNTGKMNPHFTFNRFDKPKCNIYLFF